MCGRIACSLGVNDLSCAVACKSDETRCYMKASTKNFTDDYKPSYNAAPTSIVPVLISPEQKQFNLTSVTERVLVPMRFGIIPPWMKQQDFKLEHLETHLCRLERARESKLYNPLLEKGYRCVIPCIGYYEWQSTRSINKQPYFFYNKKNSTSNVTNTNGTFSPERGWNGVKLLYLAGVYSIYTDKDGEKKYSFAIITRETIPQWKWVHHRMPVILQNDGDVNKWIKVRKYSLTSVFDILKKSADNLATYPVDRMIINNARNNIPKCMEPIDLKKPNDKLMRSWLNRPSEENTNTSTCDKEDVAETKKDKTKQFSIKKWLQNTGPVNIEKRNKTSQKRTFLDDWLNNSSPSKKTKNN